MLDAGDCEVVFGAPFVLYIYYKEYMLRPKTALLAGFVCIFDGLVRLSQEFALIGAVHDIHEGPGESIVDIVILVVSVVILAVIKLQRGVGKKM